jgi:REP element-mobilizing transposase RayT
MSQSLSQVYLHLVFSTKFRRPDFSNLPFRERLHRYLAGACHHLDSPAVIVGGIEDHIHILCRLSKTIEIATMLRELKRESSKWVKDECPRLSDFHWRSGYGAFSISPSHVPALTNYIANQAEHHRHESFQDEFRRLCRKYGVEIDERYAWD